MIDEIKNPLFGFVCQQRKALKMTQQDLADRTGVGIRFVRELEGGKPTLRLDKVNIVLDLFGQSPHCLLDSGRISMAHKAKIYPVLR